MSKGIPGFFCAARAGKVLPCMKWPVFCTGQVLRWLAYRNDPVFCTAWGERLCGAESGPVVYGRGPFPERKHMLRTFRTAKPTFPERKHPRGAFGTGKQVLPYQIGRAGVRALMVYVYGSAKVPCASGRGECPAVRGIWRWYGGRPCIRVCPSLRRAARRSEVCACPRHPHTPEGLS